MGDTTLDGVTGDWGPLDWGGGDAGGFTQPNGPQVQASDVLTQTTTATGQDSWSGTLRNLLQTATGYALQKDAIKSGLTPVRTTTGQTAFVPTSQAGSVATNPMTWVVVGVAVFAAIAIATHKG
jgi:hypothetical protein